MGYLEVPSDFHAPPARFAAMKKFFLIWIGMAMPACLGLAADGPVPAEFPDFRVPGHEREMTRLRELFYLHHSPATTCTLWDGWLPMSVLWPAVGEGQSADAMRAFYRQSLLSRPIDAEGYVATRQHRGLAHSDGWPFPLWMQGGGMGWHFSLAGDVYAVQNGAKPTGSVDGWQLDGLGSEGIDPDRGLNLAMTGPDAALTTPPVDVDTAVAPFVRLEWAVQGLASAATPARAPGARPYIAWTTADKPDFDAERRVAFSPPDGSTDLRYVNVAMYGHRLWTGRFTRLRIGFGNAGPGKVTIKSLITAVDSRHPTNNSVFVQACCDYFNWTGDVDFLRQSLPRMRTALAFAMKEFDTRENGCVVVPWVGHCGRTGFLTLPDGQKRLIPGRGIGNNYWDLLPFGHKDCLATIYFYAALRQMVELEQLIDRHAEWQMPAAPPELAANPMCRQAEEIRARASKLFWIDEAGRFVACIDADGASHDYGFTFLNLEAVYYGFASEAQSRTILDWVGGRRSVAGDTSQGEDIYHWRFAPRATTRRNVDWYLWVWHRPEDIPWGGQVQDGGAVLGWSYHDVMARLQTAGPDDAWKRLRGILDWFAEVQAEGGYRTYY
ncbi:MAG: glucosidase family protein, partial [Thermoguttaceae bacterium]